MRRKITHVSVVDRRLPVESKDIEVLCDKVSVTADEKDEIGIDDIEMAAEVETGIVVTKKGSPAPSVTGMLH